MRCKMQMARISFSPLLLRGFTPTAAKHFIMISIKFVCLLMAIQNAISRAQPPPSMPDHMKSAVIKLAKVCMKESGATKELLAQAAGDLRLPDDRNIKCFAHCMFDKVGLIDSDNMMHLELLLDVFPPEFHSLIEELINVCGTKSGADGCETAYHTMNCYLQSKPDVFRAYVGDISVH